MFAAEKKLQPYGTYELELLPSVCRAHLRGADHRLTASLFFPYSIEREFVMALLRMVTNHFCGLCAAHNGDPVLVQATRHSTLLSSSHF